MIETSIVIVLYGKINFTISCLDDLSHLNQDTHEIILVDNLPAQSKDKIANYNKIKNLKYIEGDINSFSRACNTGFRAASGKYVIFLNNDIRVSEKKTWTKLLTDTIVANEPCIVGPTGGLIDQRDFNFKYHTDKNDKPFNYLCGWCLAGSKETLLKLQEKDGEIFSEDFSFFYEDAHLGWIASQRNIKLVIQNVPIVHFEHISTNKNQIPLLYNNAKNIFTKKWKNR